MLGLLFSVTYGVSRVIPSVLDGYSLGLPRPERAHSAETLEAAVSQFIRVSAVQDKVSVWWQPVTRSTDVRYHWPRPKIPKTLLSQILIELQVVS